METPSPQKTYTDVHLFAGIGGFESGLSRTGRFKSVFASDVDITCKWTYDANFDPPLTLGDIQELDPREIPDSDLLTAGFPCQSFSNMGLNRGMDDSRGQLWFKLVEIVAVKRPKMLLFENVPGLLSNNNGETFRSMMRDLEKIGYHVKYKILNSKLYGGVPQNRQRVFMFGSTDLELVSLFRFPPLTHRPCVRAILEHGVPRTGPMYVKPGMKHFEIMVRSVTDGNSFYTWKCGMRKMRDNVSPTITKSMYDINSRVPMVKTKTWPRRVTLREAARLQGFPDKFKFSTRNHERVSFGHLGNAVTSSLVHRIGEQILRALSRREETEKIQGCFA